MSAKDPVGGNDKATAVVADDSKEILKRVGGSQSDDWNHILGNQAIQSLWVKQSDNEVRQRQYNAAIAGLIGIAPQILMLSPPLDMAEKWFAPLKSRA
jgi:hypothetical protein